MRIATEQTACIQLLYLDLTSSWNIYPLFLNKFKYLWTKSKFLFERWIQENPNSCKGLWKNGFKGLFSMAHNLLCSLSAPGELSLMCGRNLFCILFCFVIKFLLKSIIENGKVSFYNKRGKQCQLPREKNGSCEMVLGEEIWNAWKFQDV